MSFLPRHTTKPVSILLLVAFIAVLVPKELYHHHNFYPDTWYSHSHKSSSHAAFSEICPICNFQLLPYSGSITPLTIFTETVWLETTVLPVKLHQREVIQYFSGRAPPSDLT